MPSKNVLPLLPLLHIDDDANDRLLVAEAIASTETSFEYHGVEDLDSAVKYFGFLPHVTNSCNLPRPSLVLLDYDLGARCGTDFLYWLRILHRNSAIPVVMYTGSAGGHNIVECYAKGANQFLRKPQSFTRVEAIVRTLRACFSAPTPSLNFLASLPESQPDPRGVQSVSA